MVMQTINTERNLRMNYLVKQNSDYLHSLEEKVLSSESSDNINLIIKGLNFAKEIEYEHPGQSKEVYLAHPFRVSCIYKDIVKPNKLDGILLAILHNIYEVTATNKSFCNKYFSKNICDAISILTIDRSLQNDKHYLEVYYKKISDSDDFVCQIKALDKLDNLFLLCLNPSESVRLNYLKEIEEFVLPIVKMHMSHLFDYYISVIDDVKKTGHFSIDEFKKENIWK